MLTGQTKTTGRLLAHFQRIRNGEFGEPFTSDYVFDEALTVAAITGRMDIAVNVGKIILGSDEDSIHAVAELIKVDEKTLSKSWNNFKQRKYGPMSFTRHTILSQMKEFDIDALASFDAGFDRLLTRGY